MYNSKYKKIDIGGDLALNFDFSKINQNNSLNIYNKKFNYCLSSGRSAIYLSLMIIKSKIKKFKAFLPYYSCPSIAQPFKELNIEIIYYGMGSDLSTPSELPSKLDNSVFFFIHYFGINNSKIVDFLNIKRNSSKNLFIIEDVVQTCFSNNYSNNIGHFLISSFRKFLPVPDGSLLSTNYKSKLPLNNPDFEYLYYQIASKELRNSSVLEKIYLDLYLKAEKILDKKTNLNKMSLFSKEIIQSINISSINKRRIFNWKKLNIFFEKRNLKFKRLFKKIKKEEVPLAYPIIINNNKRDNFLKYLKKNRVFCAIHWNLKYKKNFNLFYDEYLISKSIVSIPIDHRIDNNNLKRLMDIIDGF